MVPFYNGNLPQKTVKEEEWIKDCNFVRYFPNIMLWTLNFYPIHIKEYIFYFIFSYNFI